MNAKQDDEKEEYDEEEQLVVVHLSGIIDPDYLKKCDGANCKILGIETEQPALQIDKMCFHGSFEDAVGTNIIFEEQANTVDGKTQTELKYMCNTVKNLDMIRVFFKREEIEDKDKEPGKEIQGATGQIIVEQKDGMEKNATCSGISTSVDEKNTVDSTAVVDVDMLTDNIGT